MGKHHRPSSLIFLGFRRRHWRFLVEFQELGRHSIADSFEFRELGRHSMADSVEFQELGRH